MNEGTRLADYLQQLIEASRDAASFIEGMDREACLADLRSPSA